MSAVRRAARAGAGEQWAPPPILPRQAGEVTSHPRLRGVGWGMGCYFPHQGVRLRTPCRGEGAGGRVVQ